MTRDRQNVLAQTNELANRRVLVLDAMGVLYESADDVVDLLVPYVHELGGTDDVSLISSTYREASLGKITSAELWASLGVSERADDGGYCERHRLAPAVNELLTAAGHVDLRVACLSNDVTEWSLLLRERFGLTKSISDWVISGDVALRKPDPAIYRLAEDILQAEPGDILFIDDRLANVLAAKEAGWNAALLGPPQQSPAEVTTIESLTEAVALISNDSAWGQRP